MTDAEIRAELAGQIEDGERIVRVDSPADGPPLMLKFSCRLRPEQMDRIRASWEDAWRSNKLGPKMLIMEKDVQVFQLLDGRWQEIG